jgi:DNA-binding PadR family transcriptional regulator
MAIPAPLGEFEVTVILAVMHFGDEATGTGVRDAITRRTGRAIARGAIYVTLDRLEDKGLLASRLDQASPERGGHPRRFFKVIPLGMKRVRHAMTMIEQMRAGLEPVLGPTRPSLAKERS